MSNFTVITEDQLSTLPDDDKFTQLAPLRDGKVQNYAASYKPIGDLRQLKSPYTVQQNKDAQFVFNMDEAQKIMNELEDSGFNPANFKDSQLMENLPFGLSSDQGMLGRTGSALQSPEYKLYQNAAATFIEMIERYRTGATMRPEEMEFGVQEMLPLYGDDPEVVEQKRQKREQQIQSMKGVAGGAYPALIKNIKGQLDSDEVSQTSPDVAEDALALIRQRCREGNSDMCIYLDTTGVGR